MKNWVSYDTQENHVAWKGVVKLKWVSFIAKLNSVYSRLQSSSDIKAKMKKISSQGLLIVNAFGPSKVKTPHKRKAENVITKECILEEIKAKRRSGKGKVKRCRFVWSIIFE